jgi:competence protein ComEC
MSKNIAQEVIKPGKAKVLRTVFLYTGQGDSTIIAIPTGDGLDDYEYVLVDSDLDKEENEVNLVCLLKDLLDGDNLSKFINTHPHKDHIGGIKKIYDEVGIHEVWHSNHSPKGDDDQPGYDELKYVLEKVGKANEYHLKGSNDLNKVRTSEDEEKDKKIGLVDFQVFAPAEYVCDDIDDEDDRKRRDRIHEQCAVLKFSHNGKSVLFTEDANKTAWKDHITTYHADALKSDVMTASHHGSRTAFKNGEEDDDPYKEHLEYIAAEYLVISAPKQKDSQHGHPHDDALEIYKEFFEDDKIYHLGETPFCLVVDIDELGNVTVSKDLKLIKAYSGEECESKETKIKKNENETSHRAAVLASYASKAKPYKR